MNTASLDMVGTLSFEEALRELEQLVRQLEEGRTTLDQTMTSYERGVALKTHCESILKVAKTKIDKITLGVDGSLSTVPLE